MKNIFVCGFSQESNSFNRKMTELESFREYGIYNGGKTPDEPLCLPQANGMIEFLKSKGCNVCCGVVMRAGSGAPVNHNVVEYFLENTIKLIKNAGRIDGVCVAMHGATLSNKTDDVCGFILEALRNEIGDNIPISVAFDLHANITDRIMENADYICGFNEYPHIDQKKTGIRAARMLYEKLNGNGGKTAKVSLPMIAPAHGYTTTKGALKKLNDYAKKMISSGEILDYTIFQVQPWLDIKELQSAVVVIAKDEECAKKAAWNIAKENFLIRRELLGEKPFTVEEVIEKALQNRSGKPVVLVDSADSPGAGANGDSAYVLEKLIPYSKILKSAVSVCDLEAVKKALSLGVGAIDDFILGAAFGIEYSAPVVVKKAKVISLHCGEYTSYSPQSKGMKYYIGKTAVLMVNKLLIHVSCCAKDCGDVNFYKSFGIDPFECDLVSVKACTSFRAAYENKAYEICNAQTPGAAGINLLEMPFKNIPTHFYPFEEISENDISEAIIYR